MLNDLLLLNAQETKVFNCKVENMRIISKVQLNSYYYERLGDMDTGHCSGQSQVSGGEECQMVGDRNTNRTHVNPGVNQM